MRLEGLARELAEELATDLVEIIADFQQKGRPSYQARRYVADYGAVFGQLCIREGLGPVTAFHAATAAYRLARRRWRAEGHPAELFEKVIGPPKALVTFQPTPDQRIQVPAIIPARDQIHPVKLPVVRGLFDA